MDYAFNATALGLGGVIERGHATTIIPSLGSIVLSPTGGEGSSEIRNYDCNDISFSTMQTRVGGYRVAAGLYSTYSDILISNLNVFNRIRVGLMQLTLTSTRKVDQPEPRFEIRASYRGVSVDDEEVIPELDMDMCSYETYEQFLRSAQETPALIAEKLNQTVDAVTALTKEPAPVVRGSIISNIAKPMGSKLAHRRNNVHVPGLGKLVFGELLLKQGRRRVNLLRLEIGDPTLESAVMDSGSVVMASGEGNGTPVWPNA
jgi:hypothetical protein